MLDVVSEHGYDVRSVEWGELAAVPPDPDREVAQGDRTLVAAAADDFLRRLT